MDFLFISKIIQIIVSVFIVLFVLIQSKGGGFTAGVGSAIGAYRSRRGLEKLVFILTIVLGFVMVVNSVLLIVLA